MSHNGKEFETLVSVAQEAAEQASAAANSSRSSSSTTTGNTAPGVRLDPWDRMVLIERYNVVMGEAMTNVIGQYIADLLQYGMELEVILYAIDETAWAKRPSPRYMKAILQRLRGEGILTSEQLLHRQMEEDRERMERARLPVDDLPF